MFSLGLLPIFSLFSFYSFLLSLFLKLTSLFFPYSLFPSLHFTPHFFLSASNHLQYIHSFLSLPLLYFSLIPLSYLSLLRFSYFPSFCFFPHFILLFFLSVRPLCAIPFYSFFHLFLSLFNSHLLFIPFTLCSFVYSHLSFIFPKQHSSFRNCSIERVLDFFTLNL